LGKKLKTKEITKDFSLTRSKISYALWGRITEQGTENGIKAIINIYHQNETTPLLTVTANDSLQGKYQAQLPDKGPFKMEITADGYVFLNDAVQYGDTTTVIEKNLSLMKIKAGVKFVMENILFNTGLATLKSSSYAELDKLVKFLAENKAVRIEVSGHTDNAGAAATNKKLSKARALAVKNYLTSKGIEESRIEYEGYGMEQPIADNKTKEGKAKNRRVEVKILE
jgi:outer membrane protein OmpA-like peptidoglycan-associated protein